jgi:hypothetical protein
VKVVRIFVALVTNIRYVGVEGHIEVEFDLLRQLEIAEFRRTVFQNHKGLRAAGRSKSGHGVYVYQQSVILADDDVAHQRRLRNASVRFVLCDTLV